MLRQTVVVALASSVLAFAVPAAAEMTPRHVEVLGHATAICSDVVSERFSDPGDHPRRGDFSWNAEISMWHWFVGADQVALRKVVEDGATYCDVIVASPRATDIDIRQAALDFALDNGYRVSDGSGANELMLAVSDANVFAVRKGAQGWRIDFEQ